MGHDLWGEGRVSIVMPVYNGGHYIWFSIHMVAMYMDYYGLNHELIVVDDGSTDDTWEKACRAASQYSYVKVVGYPHNRGKGAAFLHGYKHSSGDPVVLFDSDLDIWPEQIALLLKAMKTTGADVVVTDKWHPASLTQASMLRRLLSRGFNMLVRLLTGLNLRDTQTGAKAFRRRVLDTVAPKMYAKRYAFDIELLLLAAKHGFRIAEVPSIQKIRLKAPVKPRHMYNMLLELLSIAYRHGRVKGNWRPLEYYG